MAMLAGVFLFAGVLLGLAQMGVFQTPRDHVGRLESLSKQIERAHHIPAGTREVLGALLEQARTNCRPGKCDPALTARHNAAVERLAIALREPESAVAVYSSMDDGLLTAAAE